MTAKVEGHSVEAEQAVRDTRSAVRRQYSAEEKIRIVVGVCPFSKLVDQSAIFVIHITKLTGCSSGCAHRT